MFSGPPLFNPLTNNPLPQKPRGFSRGVPEERALNLSPLLLRARRETGTYELPKRPDFERPVVGVLRGSTAMTPLDYEHFGPVPYEWQDECHAATAEALYHALLSEPRCGKSKPIIDTACYRFLLGRSSPLYCDLVLIVAMPSGAPWNWERVEVPKHCRPDVNPLCLTWESDEAAARTEKGRRVFGSKAWRDRLIDFENHAGLRFLLVHGEAILTEPFLDLLRRLFPKSKVMVVGDESSLIMKAPPGPKHGKRTAKMHVISRQKTVVCRRIMDGTPVGEGPLDLFGQVGFLMPEPFGFKTFVAFRAHHVSMVDGTDYVFKIGLSRGEEVAPLYGFEGKTAADFAEAYAVRSGGKRWPAKEKDESTGEVKYKNLDELGAKLAEFSTRIKRRDVYKSHEKVYQKVFFEMSPEQKRVYEELRSTYEAELEGGKRVEARNVLERLMRLQQVTSNFYPDPKSVIACGSCDGEDGSCETCGGAGYVESKGPRTMRRIGNSNPRLEALGEQLTGEPTIVWCRFHQEMDDVMGLLRERGMGPVEYSGRMKTAEKRENAFAFQEGKAGSVVATQRSAGRAIALPAKMMCYYTQEYSLLSRLQSEDRAEMPGNKEGTGVLDLVAVGSKDLAIVQALIGKRRVSDVIMRESSGSWL